METLPNKYTPIATPTKGANAIKGIPNAPPILASITTEPVADTTTIKVPITSAINLFWLEDRLSLIVVARLFAGFLNVSSDFYMLQINFPWQQVKYCVRFSSPSHLCQFALQLLLFSSQSHLLCPSLSLLACPWGPQSPSPQPWGQTMRGRNSCPCNPC
jgi:hypothetical protein